MKPEEKDKIIKVLEERFAKQPCPRCGFQQFTLANGYFNQPLQEKLSGLVLGGPAIPSVAVICTRCGFISQHALGVLGLLPAKDEEKPEADKS
jgi:ribosomal protein S27AE